MYVFSAKMIFQPPLPIKKQLVVNRMPVGCLTKIIVTYQTVGPDTTFVHSS